MGARHLSVRDPSLPKSGRTGLGNGLAVRHSHFQAAARSFCPVVWSQYRKHASRMAVLKSRLRESRVSVAPTGMGVRRAWHSAQARRRRRTLSRVFCHGAERFPGLDQGMDLSTAVFRRL